MSCGTLGPKPRAPPTSEVHSATFWMLLHGSPTSKRTIIYSNMTTISLLDLGKLDRRTKEARTEKALVRKYVDGHGRARFHGTAELSKSQILGLHSFNAC